MTFLLDTTVLVYAVGEEGHPLALPARNLIASVAHEPGSATTTPEVLQEFAHVRARRRGRDDAARLTSAYADLLTPLVTIRESDIRSALDWFRRHESIGAFDAVLLALAMTNEALELVTADKALLGLPDVAVHDLSSFTG